MNTNPNLHNTFDRVIVINLVRRSERLARFNESFRAWPFKTPVRFEAIDGLTVAAPAAWDKGPGAWGCMLSHRAVLTSAIADKVSSILVLEDDAIPVPNFTHRAADFLARVPADWDCLMLGAEHIGKPIPVALGIVRCMASNRTHAFALRGRFMSTLLHYWNLCHSEHCDIVLAAMMPYFKVYAPDPFLIGQDAGDSDISGLAEPLRFCRHTKSTQSTMTRIKMRPAPDSGKFIDAALPQAAVDLLRSHRKTATPAGPAASASREITLIDAVVTRT